MATSTPPKVAVSRSTTGLGEFLYESPANTARGLEHGVYLRSAKIDFADQSDVDAYVTARGGVVGAWIFVDLYTAGCR